MRPESSPPPLDLPRTRPRPLTMSGRTWESRNPLQSATEQLRGAALEKRRATRPSSSSSPQPSLSALPFSLSLALSLALRRIAAVK